MQLIFLYGPVASGKLTVGRELAALTGFALFHNHLIVDAVGAVFPFGSEPFRRLREQMWLGVLDEAAQAGRSVIFTFAPEPTVDPALPQRVADLMARRGAIVRFVALTVAPYEQERRLVGEDRAAFGKLRDPELLRSLRPGLETAMASMPVPILTIDSDHITPKAAARLIVERLSM